MKANAISLKSTAPTWQEIQAEIEMLKDGIIEALQKIGGICE